VTPDGKAEPHLENMRTVAYESRKRTILSVQEAQVEREDAGRKSIYKQVTRQGGAGIILAERAKVSAQEPLKHLGRRPSMDGSLLKRMLAAVLCKKSLVYGKGQLHSVLWRELGRKLTD
jgi:hypothetical protein